MSYVFKGGAAGGLLRFVQQRIFEGASHEQEPYGPDQRERERERERERSAGVVEGWWNGGGKRVMKKENKRRGGRGQGGAGEMACVFIGAQSGCGAQWLSSGSH